MRKKKRRKKQRRKKKKRNKKRRKKSRREKRSRKIMRKRRGGTRGGENGQVRRASPLSGWSGNSSFKRAFSTRRGQKNIRIPHHPSPPPEKD